MEIGPILRAMSRNKIAVFLLVLEVAVTLAIVLNCAGMIVTQQKRLTKDTGLDEETLLLVDYDAFGESYQDMDYVDQIRQADLRNLRAVPGVESVTCISPTPLQGGGSSMITRANGAPPHEGIRTPLYSVDVNFLETLGLELVAGRDFVPEDLPTEPGAYAANVIVTQDLADALFPDGNALGQVLDTGHPEYKDTIVGIVRHMFTPYGGGPLETRILFYANIDRGASKYLLRVDPNAMDEMYTNLPTLLTNQQADRVVEVRHMSEVKNGGLLMENMMVKILFAVIALLLFITGVGLAGMTAFAVSRRTKQIGIRRAIGATKFQILRYFLVENSLIILGGMLLGLVAGVLLNMTLVNVADVEPLPTSLILTCMSFLMAMGWIATLLPALRGTKIEPAIATRTI